MGANTSIEWAHHTFNPWIGCTKVSPGCANCYAKADQDDRRGRVEWGPKGTRHRTSDGYWLQPLRWDREARESGERKRVFCASLADVFEGPETCQVPDEYATIVKARHDLFALIHATPNLDWLLLTKRPDNAAEFLNKASERLILLARNAMAGGPLKRIYEASVARGISHFPDWPNVWIGTSAENHEQAEYRIPELLRCPAAVRFLSCEPLLGPIDLREIRVPAHAKSDEDLHKPFTFNALKRDDDNDLYHSENHLDWVICGGESGPQARPMHPQWVSSLKAQCVDAEVAFLFKQWGEWAPDDALPADFDKNYLATGKAREYVTLAGRFDWMGHEPGVVVMNRVGKSAAGRLLGGRTWDDYPEEAAGE